MAKVIFEFDDNEENSEIDLVVNRNKLLNAIYAISDLYRSIYNYRLNENEQISIKDDKVITSKYIEESDEHSISGTKSYISQDYIERELDNILEDVRHLLDF